MVLSHACHLTKSNSDQMGPEKKDTIQGFANVDP